MLSDFNHANIKPVKDGVHRGNCPNHSKNNQNLMVFENNNGGLNVYCHAGCTEAAILDGLGLDRQVLFPEKTADMSHYRELQAEKRKTKETEGNAMSLWIELRILIQALDGRIFGDDKHPENRTECWDREKQALARLPALMKKYYK